VHWFDLTLPGIEANLALDEALLLAAEGDEIAPTLRFWEMAQPAVVLGMNSRLTEEVLLGACRADGVAIARRCSGGGAVVLAPGCLIFSLVLPSTGSSPLDARSSITEVLNRLAAKLRDHGLEVRPAGISDLAWQERKVSGNSQRRLRRYFLHHGTLLYDFDVHLAERYLPMPPRQPEYRRGRSHRQFLTNLPRKREQLVSCVCQAFAAEELPYRGGLNPAPGDPKWHQMTDLPRPILDSVRQLIQMKYGRPEWLTRR